MVAALVFALVFSYYLASLFGQLDAAFSQQKEFVPTRFYSDVTRIFPPLPRIQVENRLKGLGYQFDRTPESIHFALHQIDYPTYLIPDHHPILDPGQKEVQLHFSGDDPEAVLHSIELNGVEIPDLYLEPELIATLTRGGESKEIRSLIKFNDIPSPVWKAIIAVEDQHFMDHKGFDPKGLIRATWVNLKTLSFAQGGSTITQQLVKNLMARRTKNLFQKINELFLAVLLELRYEKEAILERYLNEVYLGQVGSMEVHGVVEGAEHFFGKRLEDLNLAEIALMAGLIRGPHYYSPYRYKDRALERQKLVLHKMVETGHIAEEEAMAAQAMPIRIAPPRHIANKAPYFVDYAKAELIRQLKGRVSETEFAAAGFRIYTTLDMSLNDSAQQAVAKGIDELEERLKVPDTDRLEGALAAVDHNTGYIRALVGGRSYSRSTFNRILNMKRQVGSTFKPFVYLTAFNLGEDRNSIPYSPGHPAEDAPWKLIYDNKRQSWEPRNYEKEYRGWTNYRVALAHSINTVAARLGMEVGIENVIQTARILGITSDLPAVPSLSLGVAELSPVELLRAYATIANHGVQEEFTVVRFIAEENGDEYARFLHDTRQVLPPGPVDLLIDVMQNVFIDGTASSASRLGFDRPAAGKTGTTSHHRDSWFAGFTPQLTAVVWVGMDQSPSLATKEGKARIKLTGAGSALPIWIRFMKDALAGEPPITFPMSAHLSQVRIDRHSGQTAAGDCPDDQAIVEKYISGREPRWTTCEPTWPASENETIVD